MKETKDGMDSMQQTMKETEKSMERTMKETEKSMQQTIESRLMKTQTNIEESTTRLSTGLTTSTFGVVFLITLLTIFTAVANKIGKPEFLGNMMNVMIASGIAVVVGAAYVRFF